ncbi:response regulator [soil metagenome]
MTREGFEILLVEDNPGDVRLTQEVLKTSAYNTRLKVVYDGEEALDYLLQLTDKNVIPDLILLDLNLPRRNGLEVLEVIKKHPRLMLIPIVMLTSSEAPHDIDECYSRHANSYITKPVDFDEYFKVVNMIEKFWFSIVKLPD